MGAPSLSRSLRQGGDSEFRSWPRLYRNTECCVPSTTCSLLTSFAVNTATNGAGAAAFSTLALPPASCLSTRHITPTTSNRIRAPLRLPAPLTIPSYKRHPQSLRAHLSPGSLQFFASCRAAFLPCAPGTREYFCCSRPQQPQSDLHPW